MAYLTAISEMQQEHFFNLLLNEVKILTVSYNVF